MPYTLDKRKSTLFRERPWVFLYGSLLAGFFPGGYASALFPLAILPIALGCFVAGTIYDQWRLRPQNDLHMDRWGYFPPETLGANKL